MVPNRFYLTLMLGLTTFALVEVLYFYNRLGNSPEYNLTLSQTRDEAEKGEILMDTAKHSDSPITIVTAFFPIKKSKHNINEYETWIRNFLTKIETPIVIFTVQEWVPKLKGLRSGKPTEFHVLKDIWDSPAVSSLKDIYYKQHKIDPEASIHSPELYAVWNSKAWFVAEASRLDTFNSSYFYWVDIGCFRDGNHLFRFWPDISIVEETFKEFGYDKIHLFTTQEYDKTWNIKDDPNMSLIVWLVGGFFRGPKPAVLWFNSTYYTVHDVMLARGNFVGKEQTIMHRLSVIHNEKLIVTCTCGSFSVYNHQLCGDVWFMFQSWYSSAKERGGCDFKGVIPMSRFLPLSSISL